MAKQLARIVARSAWVFILPILGRGVQFENPDEPRTWLLLAMQWTQTRSCGPSTWTLICASSQELESFLRKKGVQPLVDAEPWLLF